MSIKLIESVFDSTQGLKPSARLLLAMMADYADEDGYCFPSLTTLANRMGLSVRGTQKIIAELCELGYLQKQVAAGRPTPHGKTNLYQLTLPSDDRNSRSWGEPEFTPGDEQPFTPGVNKLVHPNRQYINTTTPNARAREKSPDDFKVPIDWTPDRYTRHMLTAMKITPDEIDALLPEFKAYWNARTDCPRPEALGHKFISHAKRCIDELRKPKEQRHETYKPTHKLSAVERAEAATRRGLERIERERAARDAAALAENDGDLRTPLDGEFWRGDNDRWDAHGNGANVVPLAGRVSAGANQVRPGAHDGGGRRVAAHTAAVREPDPWDF